MTIVRQGSVVTFSRSERNSAVVKTSGSARQVAQDDGHIVWCVASLARFNRKHAKVS
jgi:hypothetical protein